eukprot:Skav203901  [mRNA]  locus=scaffold1649:280295:281697:- [translate_table: standard]
MSMVQRQASPLPRRNVKPWEVYDYVTANYHKAGVFITEQLHYKVFTMLGAQPYKDMGKIEYPCDTSLCLSVDAPIIDFTDGFNASWRDEHPRKKPLLVAGCVRDPLKMVVSAYCYHHAGQEPQNAMVPVKRVMGMGPEEGTAVTAEGMLEMIEWMASVFAEPDNSTLRLDFDTITQSSSGFDREVGRYVDHFFGGLITPEQRSQMKEEAKSLDAHRNASATLSPFDGKSHSSSPECLSKSFAAIPKMDSALLRRYQELQKRLGFPVYSSNDLSQQGT